LVFDHSTFYPDEFDFDLEPKLDEIF